MQIHITKNGKQSGPYSESHVRDMLESGLLSRSDLAWHDGLTDWMPQQSVLSLTSPPPVREFTSSVNEQIANSMLAERGTRLGAAILDFLIFVGCMIPGIVLLAAANIDDTMMGFGVILLCIAIPGVAITQLYLLSTRDQSIGKRIVGIRIVKLVDNSNPGFVKAGLLRTFLPNLIGGIPYVGWIFSIIDCCFIFRDDRRCIHDLIAETKVVKV